MDYAAAAAKAPPGWSHFTARDFFERLPPAVRSHELARIPAADLRSIDGGDRAAEERLVRAEFWTLVYHLEPERWDALSRAEPVSSEMIKLLPRVERALDVGAGSGRLTMHLSMRAEVVAAIEPALGLAAMLRDRMPGHVHTVAGWAESLPVRDGWSQLTAACGAFGPDPVVLGELARVTGAGGVIALVNPEEPEWFESNGWQLHEVEPAAVKAHDRWIEEFFGPPDPPRVLVMKEVQR